MNTEITDITPKQNNPKNKILVILLAVLVVFASLGYYLIMPMVQKSPANQTQTEKYVYSANELKQIVLSQSTNFPKVTGEGTIVQMGDLPLEVKKLLDPEAKNVTVKKTVFEGGKMGWVIAYDLNYAMKVGYDRMNMTLSQTWNKTKGVVGQNTALMEFSYPKNVETIKLKALFFENETDASKSKTELQLFYLK